MIDFIEIEGYLSHKKTTISLSHGVNYIKGPSHSGKSVIIRALKWVLEGRPLGDSFMNWWSDYVRVAIAFNEESWIEKTRKNGKNTYNSSHGGPYEAMKAEVPSEILAVAQMSDLNIRDQGAGWFMVGKNTTPGQVAKMLNKAAHLEVIDVVVKKANDKARDITRSIIDVETRIETKESRIKGLAYVDRAEKQLNIVDNLLDELRTIDGSIESTSRLCETIREKEVEVNEMTEVIEDLEPRLIPLEEKAKELVTLDTRISNLENSLSLIHKNEDLIESVSGLLEAEQAVNRAADKLKELNRIDGQLSLLTNIVTTIHSKEEVIQKQGDLIIEQVKLIDQTLIDLKICPTCGQSTEGLKTCAS